MEFTEITWAEWIEQYKPVLNEYGEPILFDGDEDIFSDINPEKVWTLKSVDDDEFVSSGWSFINRMGYYITEVTAEKSKVLVIPDEDFEID